MKKIFLLVAFTALSVSFSNLNAADNISQKNSVPNSENKLALTINLGDISNLSASDIAKKIDSSIENTYAKQDKAESLDELERTVSVTVTAGVGANTLAVSTTITGPCAQVRTQAVKMTRELVAEIKTMF